MGGVQVPYTTPDYFWSFRTVKRKVALGSTIPIKCTFVKTVN